MIWPVIEAGRQTVEARDPFLRRHGIGPTPPKIFRLETRFLRDDRTGLVAVPIDRAFATRGCRSRRGKEVSHPELETAQDVRELTARMAKEQHPVILSGDAQRGAPVVMRRATSASFPGITQPDGTANSPERLNHDSERISMRHGVTGTTPPSATRRARSACAPPGRSASPGRACGRGGSGEVTSWRSSLPLA